MAVKMERETDRQTETERGCTILLVVTRLVQGLRRFRGFAPGSENDPLPLTWINDVCTNVLCCDVMEGTDAMTQVNSH